MVSMAKRKKRDAGRPQLTVPAHLPPVVGLDERDEYAPGRRPRTWIWTLAAGAVVVLLVAYVVVLGVMAVIDGLEDRRAANQQLAQEHYTLGVAHMEAGQYELAMAELRLATRYDSDLLDARTLLREAEAKALAQVTPTSETRQDAAATLYEQAIAAFRNGNLGEAVTALNELRGLDSGYERASVQTMLVTAQYQLGVNAVREDRLEEAAQYFQAVLALKADHADAQNQLNLLNLYTAALSNWGQDWPATIQAFKGLYSLAPEYKDVRIRLHDAHTHWAEQLAKEGKWCSASEAYAGAVSALVLEQTVDLRDDAALKCQSTAEAPPPATARPKPTAAPGGGSGTAVPGKTPAATAAPPSAGQGQIAFTGYDAVQQRYDVYIVDLARGTALLVQENASQATFGPGGNRIAFRNRHPSHLGLSVTTLGSGQFTEVTGHAEDTFPAWSPDANQLAFASNKHGDRKWRIYAISPGEVKGEGVEWAYGRAPSWSPDGKRLAYQGCDERGEKCGIWQMRAGGGGAGRVTTDPSDTAPTWSPDGKKIAFISARSGNWELFVVDLPSGKEQRLTDNRAADVAPAWSPDGKKLAFLSNTEGAWAVYILDVARGRVQKVIATGDAYPEPVDERLSWVK